MVHGIRVVRLVCALVSLAVLPADAFAQDTKGESSRPLMAQLHRFSARNVPELGPEETEVIPKTWHQPVPPGLPGKGMAEHPMLYIGEGYNRILLVNKGKIAWTYSTGTGWEYDDTISYPSGSTTAFRLIPSGRLNTICPFSSKYDLGS